MQTCISNIVIQSQGTLSSLLVSPNVKEKPLLNALLLMAGLKGHRRLRHACSIRAASGQGPREPAAPSAPPLPRELRTSERIKYPEVYGEDQYATGQPGLREDQGPVDQSVFETDQVQVSFPPGGHCCCRMQDYTAPLSKLCTFVQQCTCKHLPCMAFHWM